MHMFRILLTIFLREYSLNFRKIYNVLTIFIFFILGIMIFIFSIGPYKEIHNQIGVGIIWTLLILSGNLAIKNIMQDDFDDGNLTIIHLSGISFEIIVLIKMLSSWLFFQFPFLIIIPIACVLLNIEPNKIYIIIIIFIISSPILTCISVISSSMNLLNDRNFTVGSLILMFLSIPLIIFSVGTINANQDLYKSQLNILIGILLLFIAITPWIGSTCIKISNRNK